MVNYIFWTCWHKTRAKILIFLYTFFTVLLNSLPVLHLHSSRETVLKQQKKTSSRRIFTLPWRPESKLHTGCFNSHSQIVLKTPFYIFKSHSNVEKKIWKYRPKLLSLLIDSLAWHQCFMHKCHRELTVKVSSRCWTWSDDGYAVMTMTLIAVKVFMVHRSCA